MGRTPTSPSGSAGPRYHPSRPELGYCSPPGGPPCQRNRDEVAAPQATCVAFERATLSRIRERFDTQVEGAVLIGCLAGVL